MTTKPGRNALLCDAAFSALPILFSLKNRGFRVGVCGSRPNDPGHALADFSFPLDYSNEKLLLEIVRTNAIEFLVPGCTDVSYRSCASVANVLGLPGYDRPESVSIIHQKDAFREYCDMRGFPIPQFVSDASRVPELSFPILIKPSDSFSGKGIVRVESYDRLPDGIEEAKSHSSARSILFEEFIDGCLYSHSAVLRRGKIAWDIFVNEYCSVHPYQVNSSHVSIDLAEGTAMAVRNWLQDFARALSLADGLVHTQFIATENSFYLIEVTRRCPGDLYAMLVEMSLGIDYAFAYASSFCNEELPATLSDFKTRRNYSRHTVSVEHDCFFLSTQCTLPHCRPLYVPLKKTGELLHAAPLDRAGIYFIEHDSPAAMLRLTPRLRDYIQLQTN
jgi:biotin carboxylase